MCLFVLESQYLVVQRSLRLNFQKMRILLCLQIRGPNAHLGNKLGKQIQKFKIVYNHDLNVKIQFEIVLL